MVFARAGQVLDCLAEVAAMQLGSSRSGRSDQDDGEALVEGHLMSAACRNAKRLRCRRAWRRPSSTFRSSRARATRPTPRHATNPSRLSFAARLVEEADDAFRQAGAVVSRNARRAQGRVAPACCNQLLPAGGGSLAEAAGGRPPPSAGAADGRRPLPNMIITGTGLVASFGVTSVIWISTGDARERRVGDVADELSADHRVRSQRPFLGCGCRRCHLRHVARNPSDDLALEDSTISGRRSVFQTWADVTFVPFASVEHQEESDTGWRAPHRSWRDWARTRCRWGRASFRMPSRAIMSDDWQPLLRRGPRARPDPAAVVVRDADRPTR